MFRNLFNYQLYILEIGALQHFCNTMFKKMLLVQSPPNPPNSFFINRYRFQILHKTLAHICQKQKEESDLKATTKNVSAMEYKNMRKLFFLKIHRKNVLI